MLLGFFGALHRRFGAETPASCAHLKLKIFRRVENVGAAEPEDVYVSYCKTSDNLIITL